MGFEHHTISIHFARTIIEAAKRNKLNYKSILDFASLHEPMLSKPNLRITPEQFSLLMRETMREADDEFICMGSRPSRQGVFTLMAKQAVQCHNLKAAYRHLCRFYNLVAEAVELEFEVSEDTASISTKLTNKDMDPDHTLREFLLLLWHRFPSWLIGQRIHLLELDLEFPEPKHKAEYRLMYGCPIKYNQPTNRLVFKSDLLEAPIIQNQQTLRTYLQRAPLDWFKRQEYFQVFTRRVLNYLEQQQENKPGNMDEIANELHVTTRTLRRKLEEEGTSFQELKDGIRRDTAIHLLSQPSIPISEISNRLGFSDPAAFTRAFKQWTGVTPGVYRRK